MKLYQSWKKTKTKEEL